jgi:hypothetical protein
MVGEDATKEGITAIIIDTVSDVARALSFWMRMHPILQVGWQVLKHAIY